MTNRVRRCLLTALLAVSATSDLACYQGETQGNSGAGAESGTAGDGGESPALEEPAPSTRLHRLTHQQWENTVQDLFYLSAPTELSSKFRSDAREGGYMFDNHGPGLEVDQALWNNYRGAAIELAAMVISDENILDAILPADGGDETRRARLFIDEFGQRVFRRPLRAEEIEEYQALFLEAPALYAEDDAFDAGVRMSIEAMLQSPYFIYRVEESEVVADGVIALSEFEVASKLSYALWNSMPDDELLEAAAAGTLKRDLRIHAQRMLEDPRTRPIVERFHEVVFKASKFASLERSSTLFPGVPEDLGALAIEEFRHFVGDIIFDGDGGVRELFLSTQSYVNDDLARIYGLEGSFGDELQPVTLPSGQRRGILTQIGFLAANSSSTNPDPIHRGIFVLDRVVCTPVPAPPDVIPPLPTVAGQTNREAIAELTEQPGSTCAGCHKAFINPYGFAFENYDAIGAFRVQDNGFPVNAAATILLDGAQVSVSNPFELVDVLVNSPSVHACYAKHWVEYMNGRATSEEDLPLIERLAAQSLSEGLSLRSLLLELIMSPAFQLRSVQELGT